MVEMVNEKAHWLEGASVGRVMLGGASVGGVTLGGASMGGVTLGPHPVSIKGKASVHAL